MTRANSPITLTYSILAGPVLWFIHFVLVYIVADFGCRANFNNLLFVTPDNIRVFIVGATLVSLAAVGVGGVLAYRRWASLSNHEENDTPQEAYTRFLVVLGILLSALFLLAIITTAAPTFFLNVCDRVT